MALLDSGGNLKKHNFVKCLLGHRGYVLKGTLRSQPLRGSREVTAVSITRTLMSPTCLKTWVQLVPKTVDQSKLSLCVS